MRVSGDIQDPEAPRLLDEARARQVVDEIKQNCSAQGSLDVNVESWWGGSQRWARNRASMTSDQREQNIRIIRRMKGASLVVTTNQIDSKSLKGACDLAEHYVKQWSKNTIEDLELQVPTWQSKGARVWSDDTYNRTFGENGQVVHALTQRSASEGLLSAGFIEMTGASIVKYNRDDWGRETTRVARVSQAQCSTTVRHPKATGSGWAGHSSFDITRLDISKIAELAFDKCVKSLDPVRIEPGRYQTILEPQAVALLAEILVLSLFSRSVPEGGPSTWFMSYDTDMNRFRSKLGLRVVDERINIHHDPTDPIVGTHVSDAVDKVELVKNGVLTTIYNDYRHSLNELNDANPSTRRTSFQFDGGQTSMDEMVKTTKRGLLVTRFSQPDLLDNTSMLYTGVTRDGLWLIENGKITKAVRNFRWTESPLFIFNNVVQLGAAVPVFSPTTGRTPWINGFENALKNIVVPALKVNDFSFTSTIDAI